MATEIWTANSSPERLRVAYSPGGTYPIEVEHRLEMPGAYDPATHLNFPFSTTPVLQGFDMNFGREGNLVDHHLRQLRVEVRRPQFSWYTDIDIDNGVILAQGPIVELVVGLRDDSGGDPPDDSFVGWIDCAVLVVYMDPGGPDLGLPLLEHQEVKVQRIKRG
jgi:hypothetical protein